MNEITISDLKLSPKEQKAFEVLIDPDNRSLTLEQKAEKAGISRQALWAMLKRDSFISALKHRNLGLIRASSVAIVNTMVSQAVKGEFSQQRTLLEIADYFPKDKPLIDNRQVNITITPEKEERLKLVVDKLEHLQRELQRPDYPDGEIIKEIKSPKDGKDIT